MNDLRSLQNAKEGSRLQQMMKRFLEDRIDQDGRITTSRTFYTTTTTTTVNPYWTTTAPSISKQSDIPIFDSNSIDLSKSSQTEKTGGGGGESSGKSNVQVRDLELPVKINFMCQFAFVFGRRSSAGTTSRPR